MPPFRLRALPVGECDVCEHVVFAAGHACEGTRRFLLYVWLIHDERHTTLVDTGPKDVAAFNAATAKYIPGGLRNTGPDVTRDALAAADVDVGQVELVIASHLHADHYEAFDMFPNATLVTSRKGFLGGMEGIKRPVMQALAARWPESLRLVEDDEVLPGLRVFEVGGHSPCSVGVAVDTAAGRIVLAGDNAYLFSNLEEDIPIGWCDPDESRRAMAMLRAAGDLVLPGHDPELMRRHPGGIIA